MLGNHVVLASSCYVSNLEIHQEGLQGVNLLGMRLLFVR